MQSGARPEGQILRRREVTARRNLSSRVTRTVMKMQRSLSNLVVASSTSPRNALSEINMASASNKAMKLAHAPTIPRAASQPADMHEYWSATASTSALPRASSSNDLNRRGDRE